MTEPLLAETNVLPIVVLIVVLVVLGLVTLVAVFKRRDTQDATGVLSREAVRKDRSAVVAPLGAQGTGKEIERIAEVERRGGAVEARGSREVAAWVPPDPDKIAVTRRQFFNRGIIAFFGFGLAMFGVQVIAFLWPTPKGGFGSKINVGKIDDILAKIGDGKGFYYLPEGRMWITEYPASAVGKAESVYPPTVLGGMKAGVVALYQKCPHLGCRVPSCVTSQWFECPCHGSQYNRVGEKKGGPAPRGMDHFAMAVAGGQLTVDTGTIIQGPAIGTNTTGQEAEGPHCVSGGGH
jgi:cytochrome b6-f complex iron-sulfur subunit